jgi:hypothetical protein
VRAGGLDFSLLLSFYQEKESKFLFFATFSGQKKAEIKMIKTIFDIDGADEFRAAALETFRFQAEHCAPYREYIGWLGVERERVDTLEKIPFLPIEAFKSHRVYSAGSRREQAVFTSSSTGGQRPSRHPVADLSLYEESFTRAFRLFYGDPAQYAIFALLPGYLERTGSSLVFMADRLIRMGHGGGFFLHDHRALLAAMDAAAADGKNLLLLGVSFALWELAEKYRFDYPRLTVMETGGMKGRRREITRGELHAILCESFGVAAIHSEYGMAELLSQAYSDGGGVFRCPPWMRVSVRELYDPLEPLPPGRPGGVDVIDLANRYSCSFVETQDLGTVFADGRFRIDGRIDRSEIRGCNLLVQDL